MSSKRYKRPLSQKEIEELMALDADPPSGSDMDNNDSDDGDDDGWEKPETEREPFDGVIFRTSELLREAEDSLIFDLLDIDHLPNLPTSPTSAPASASVLTTVPPSVICDSIAVPVPSPSSPDSAPSTSTTTPPPRRRKIGELKYIPISVELIRSKSKPNVSTKWYPGKDNEFSNKPPQYTGSEAISISGKTPYDFFSALFTDNIMHHIVEESNKYALITGKELKLTYKELQVYLGINIIMTYLKYPRSRMYWSSIKGLRLSCIADFMSVNRFEDIKRFLHFADNGEPSTTDKYWKLRPIFEMLHTSFHSAGNNMEHQAIDEMIVPFKGRSGLKQYIKNKPTKWGFKFWARANADGYVHCIEPYQSTTAPRTVYGPIGDMVLRLCHGIGGKGHKLFIDNLFTSLVLLQTLRENEIFVVGTLRINRAKAAEKTLVNAKLLQRGWNTVTTNDDNITIVRWKDSKPVHTISTYCGAQPEDEVKRWDPKSKSRIEVARPYSIAEYNKFMGGVDLVDRMIAHYPHGFKSKKWYLRIFFHLLNISIVNSWLLYKKQTTPTDASLLAFKASVANSLITRGTTDLKRGRPSNSPVPLKKTKSGVAKVSVEIKFDGNDHYPKKMESKNASRCHALTCKSKTRYICKKCSEPVCPECMESFHNYL